MVMNNGNQPPEPIVHEVCPVCGSKERSGAAFIRKLKDAKLLPEEAFAEAFVFQVPLVDTTHPPVLLAEQRPVPVALIYWDVCECGTIYCTKFIEGAGMAQFQNQPPGSRSGRPPFMPPTSRRN